MFETSQNDYFKIEKVSQENVKTILVCNILKSQAYINLFSLYFQKQKSIEITYKNKQVAFSRVFLAPEQNFKLHLNKKTQRHQPVLDLDVTNEGLGVSCSHEGSLLIWLTSNGQIRVT